MTIFRRILLRSAPTRRPLPAIPQTLNPPPPRACSRDLPNPRLLCHRSFEHYNASEVEVVNFVPGRGGAGLRCLVYPAVLAGLIGLGGLEVAYADAEEGASKQGLPADVNNVEEVAKKQRQEIEDLLKRKGIRGGSIPNFTVSVKGQKVTIKFQIPPACEASQLIANIASNLGLKVEEHGGGSDVSLRAWDSGVAWQLMLMHPEKQKETEGDQGELKDVNKHDRDLHILIFRSVITSTERTEIEFMKQGGLSPKELDALVSALQLAGGKIGKSTTERRGREDSTQSSSIEKLITSLESMGVRVYGVHEPNESSASKAVSWDNLAGYDLQKRRSNAP